MPYKFTHLPRLSLQDKTRTINNESDLEYGSELFTLNVSADPAGVNTYVSLGILTASSSLVHLNARAIAIGTSVTSGLLTFAYLADGQSAGNEVPLATVNVTSLGYKTGTITEEAIPADAELFFKWSTAINAEDIVLIFQLLSFNLAEATR